MNTKRIINIIEVITLLISSITALILLIYFNPSTLKSYLTFDIIFIVVNPLIHLLFLAIKLWKIKKYNPIMYTDTFSVATLVYGVALYYIGLYLDGFSTFIALYYLGLVVPFLFIPLVIYLGKKKEAKIRQNASKIKMKK